MLWISVEHGDIFEGTLEQWQDCFFSNADEEMVRQYCNDNDWRVEFTYPEEVVGR